MGFDFMMNTQCSVCKHYYMSLGCDAFPDGIPENILAGKFDHTEIHPEQGNDFVFEHYLIEINNDILMTFM